RPALLPVDGARRGARRRPAAPPRAPPHPRPRRARVRAADRDDRALRRAHPAAAGTNVGRRPAVSTLGEIAARFGLTPGATAALERVLDLQAADPTAPTTVCDPAAAADRHVADSLVALALPEVR